MSTNDDTSGKRNVATAIGAATGGAVAGFYAHRTAANAFADQLIDKNSAFHKKYEASVATIADYDQLEKVTEAYSKVTDQATDIVHSPKFIEKAVALSETSAFDPIVSSRNGLDHLSAMPEMVDHVLLKRGKDGAINAEVVLNQDGLFGITPEMAKKQRLSNVEFHPKTGKAIKGSFIIHNVSQDVDVLAEPVAKGVRKVEGSQVENISQKWLKKAEKSIAEAEASLRNEMTPQFSKIFRESAPKGWFWQNMPKTSKMTVIGVALAGAVTGGFITHLLTRGGHRHKEEQRQLEAQQSSPFKGF